jgi:hypothetical protein
LFQDDQDIKTLMPLAESVMRDIIEGYRAKFNGVVMEMKQDVLKQKEMREDELNAYRRCVSDASESLDRESIDRIHAFQQNKKRVHQFIVRSDL